jgi:DNA-binding response OmpR family regulator
VNVGLLEDDAAQAERMMSLLAKLGYSAQHFATGAALLESLRRSSFDLLLVDWELPDQSGIDVLKMVRTVVDWHIPILFVTQRDSEQDVVEALDAGADDYLVKEVRERELAARIQALLRRLGNEPQTVQVSHVELDRRTRSARCHGKPVELTAKDFELAWYLLHNIGRLLSRQQLLRDVWGVSVPLNTRTVDVHMSRLRRRLDFGLQGPMRIRTVYQHGYRLELAE